MHLFNDVGVFHAKFGLPRSNTFTRPAAILSEELWMYRLRFMEEELQECRDAHEAGDIVKFCDALADLVWVALGTAHFAGIPFDDVWAHVRRANLDKILAPPEGDAGHKRDSEGHKETIRKPPDWKGPEAGIRSVLESQRRFIESGR